MMLMRIIAYVRVSTSEQADSRAGLEAQRAAILREAIRQGWANPGSGTRLSPIERGSFAF